MKTRLLLAVAVLTLIVSSVNAEIISIPLPELVGEHQVPFNTDFSFDFDTSFTQVDDFKIQIVGTYTAGQAHGDGLWNPVDQTIELQPVIDMGVIPDEENALCIISWNPIDSPYNVASSFELMFGATWDFLLDGAGQGHMSLGHGILNGWDVDFEPTIDVSEAYLVVHGVVPEPASAILLGLGGILLRA